MQTTKEFCAGLTVKDYKPFIVPLAEDLGIAIDAAMFTDGAWHSARPIYAESQAEIHYRASWHSSPKGLCYLKASFSTSAGDGMRVGYRGHADALKMCADASQLSNEGI